jgi:hypothetical protein
MISKKHWTVISRTVLTPCRSLASANAELDPRIFIVIVWPPANRSLGEHAAIC